MDALEAKTKSDEIDLELEQELKSARTITEAPQAEIAQFSKPRLNVGSAGIKLFCRGENFVMFRVATRDFPEAVKERVKHLSDVSDKEVELTKNVIDQYGSDHLSPELIEMINKYSNSPLAPLIQFKIDQYNVIRAQAKLELRKIEQEKRS